MSGQSDAQLLYTYNTYNEILGIWAKEIPQSEIMSVEVGNTVLITLDNGEKYEGVVNKISSIANQSTRTFDVEILIVCFTNTPSNQPHLLLRLVTVPNSLPTLPSSSPILFFNSVGKGPSPTLVG